MKSAPTRPAAGSKGGPFAAAHSGPFHVVQFDFGSAEIPPGQLRELKRAAEEIPPNSRIAVRGYTCIIGPKPYNDRLARRRALAVARQLDRLGVAPFDAIAVEGRGKCCYVDDNATPEGRARNRRAEVHVIQQRGATQ